MSIKSEVERIATAKENVRIAIQTKDSSISIPENELIDTYPEYIDKINNKEKPSVVAVVMKFTITLDDTKITNLSDYVLKYTEYLTNISRTLTSSSDMMRMSIATDTLFTLSIYKKDDPQTINNYYFGWGSDWLYIPSNNTFNEHTISLYTKN